MLDLYVDIDGCPVYAAVAAAARLYSVQLYVVTRGFVAVPPAPMVHLVLAEDDGDSGDDWIASNIAPGDICVTGKPSLAARCLLRRARVLAPAGAVWTVGSLSHYLEARCLVEVAVTGEAGNAAGMDRAYFARQLAAVIGERPQGSSVRWSAPRSAEVWTQIAAAR